MIILNASQAGQCTGVISEGYALSPVPLSNGTEWVLPEDVLTAEAYAPARAALSALTTRDVLPSEFNSVEGL